MADGALVVFTRKSKESLLNSGGTSAWAINPSVVRRFGHVICVRNSSIDPNDEARPGPEPRGAAFLVGKIASIDWLYYENERNRYRVSFSEVAEVSIPDFWDGSRNPVRYYTMEEVQRRGINFDELDFVPLPPQSPASPASPAEAKEYEAAPQRLGFAEARRQFAEALGVAVEEIEIRIVARSGSAGSGLSGGGNVHRS